MNESSFLYSLSHDSNDNNITLNYVYSKLWVTTGHQWIRLSDTVVHLWQHTILGQQLTVMRGFFQIRVCHKRSCMKSTLLLSYLLEKSNRKIIPQTDISRHDLKSRLHVLQWQLKSIYCWCILVNYSFSFHKTELKYHSSRSVTLDSIMNTVIFYILYDLGTYKRKNNKTQHEVL